KSSDLALSILSVQEMSDDQLKEYLLNLANQDGPRVKILGRRKPSRAALTLWNKLLLIASRGRFEDKIYLGHLASLREPGHDRNGDVLAALAELRAMVIVERGELGGKRGDFLDGLFQGRVFLEDPTPSGQGASEIHFRFSETVLRLQKELKSGFG